MQSNSSVTDCTVCRLSVDNDTIAGHPGQVNRSPSSSPLRVKGIRDLHTGHARVCGMSFSIETVIFLFQPGRKCSMVTTGRLCQNLLLLRLGQRGE